MQFHHAPCICSNCATCTEQILIFEMIGSTPKCAFAIRSRETFARCKRQNGVVCLPGIFLDLECNTEFRNSKRGIGILPRANPFNSNQCMHPKYLKFAPMHGPVYWIASSLCCENEKGPLSNKLYLIWTLYSSFRCIAHLHCTALRYKPAFMATC